MFRRCSLAAAFLTATAVSLSALACRPWEAVSVTSHYDANGGLAGVEAAGAFGFLLAGETGASSSDQMYNCGDINDLRVPF